MSSSMRLDSSSSSSSSNGAATTAISINTGEIVDAVGDAAATIRPLSRLLFASGFSTMLMDLATALYKPPRGVVFEGHKLAYYLMLAAIFAAGMAEVSTAVWFSRYGRNHMSLVKAMVCMSVLPLVAVIALGGFTVLMKG
ncbi:hypothetical protein QOZ80_1BG0058160 [Eleusine coracana subsp. coracana]|nr:hypothetical protein QOZ80_1BG0058160 [Eleusine coracana subsp. coracana]